MEEFKKQYRDLEQRILLALREKVESSKQTSQHTATKSINVNVFDYAELTIVNDNLTFLDSNGYHYTLFIDCDLEDLIDILNT